MTHLRETKVVENFSKVDSLIKYEKRIKQF